MWVMPPAVAHSAFFAAAATESGEPRREIMLMPIGEITARDGRKWYVRDRAHAEAIVAASQEWNGGTDMPLDYDHQIRFGAVPGVGAQAKASGWAKALVVRDDGIWAAPVEWTAAAEAMLRAREYRYVSPLFNHDADGRVTRIINASLTNTPAIRELPAVASALGGDLQPQDTPSMKFTDQLVQTLGLAATATEADILAAVQSRTAAATASAVLAPVATALGLAATAGANDVVAAATAAMAEKADPAKFAPMSLVTELQGQLKALTEGQAEAAATAAVEAAIEDFKVSPGQKDWALGYARKDLKGFQDYVAAAAAIVPSGKAQTPRLPAGAEPELTPELAAAAAAIGCTPEEILATAKAEN
jgi:phage I-like protein